MDKFRKFWERFVAVMLMPDQVMGQTSAYQQKMQMDNMDNKLGLWQRMRSIRSHEQTEL